MDFQWGYGFVLVDMILLTNFSLSLLLVHLQVKQTGVRTRTAESPTHTATRSVPLSASSSNPLCSLCPSGKHTEGNRAESGLFRFLIWTLRSVVEVVQSQAGGFKHPTLHPSHWTLITRNGCVKVDSRTHMSCGYKQIRTKSSEIMNHLSISAHRLHVFKTGLADLTCSIFGDSSQHQQPQCNVQFTLLQLSPATF